MTTSIEMNKNSPFQYDLTVSPRSFVQTYGKTRLVASNTILSNDTYSTKTESHKPVSDVPRKKKDKG